MKGFLQALGGSIDDSAVVTEKETTDGGDHADQDDEGDVVFLQR